MRFHVALQNQRCGLSGGEREVRTGLLTVPKRESLLHQTPIVAVENAIRNLLSGHAAFYFIAKGVVRPKKDFVFFTPNVSCSFTTLIRKEQRYEYDIACVLG